MTCHCSTCSRLANTDTLQCQLIPPSLGSHPLGRRIFEDSCRVSAGRASETFWNQFAYLRPCPVPVGGRRDRPFRINTAARRDSNFILLLFHSLTLFPTLRLTSPSPPFSPGEPLSAPARHAALKCVLLAAPPPPALARLASRPLLRSPHA